MPLWFQILTGIFSVVGVLCSIAGIIFAPIRKRLKNKITTKNIVISYKAEAPKISNNYPRPIVEGCIVIYNKTNTDLTITQLDLVDGDVVIQINNFKETGSLSIKAREYYFANLKFVVPSPPKYVMSPQCTLRIEANGVILDYPVSTNSSVAPY